MNNRSKNSIISTIAENLYGYTLAFSFFCISLAINIFIAINTGSGLFVSCIFVALATTAQTYVAVIPIITLGRGNYTAAVIALPLWLVCVSYSWNAALKFFDQVFINTAVKQDVVRTEFEATVKQLETARVSREKITLEKSTGEITQAQASILALPGKYGKTVGQRTLNCSKFTSRAPKLCTKYSNLGKQLEIAKRRDALDGRILKLSNLITSTSPVGKTRSDGYLAPLIGWIRLKTGIQITTQDDLMVLMLLLISELGAGTVPIILSLSSGKNRGRIKPPKKVRRLPDALSSLLQQQHRISSTSINKKTSHLLQWQAQNLRTEASNAVPFSELFKDFTKFCGGADALKALGVTPQKFGRMLGDELGLPKQKMGDAQLMYYLGVSLKSSGQVSGTSVLPSLSRLIKGRKCQDMLQATV